MKKILFLLAIVGLVATGCQSTGSDNSSNPTNPANALPDNGHMPAPPVGGGTQGIH